MSPFWIIEKAVWFFSAEFVVEWRHRNGSAEIVFRTFWTAAWVFGFLLVSHTLVTYWQDGFPEALWPPCALVSHVGWLALEHNGLFLALFAGVYAALYARFSSQWRYLADLYNLILQAECTHESMNPEKLAEWRVSFIADALTLHLLAKQIFLSVAQDWYRRDPEVPKEIKAHWTQPQIEFMERLLGPAATVTVIEPAAEVRKPNQRAGSEEDRSPGS